MKSDCIFCQIVQGTLESHKIYEDSNVISFLDKRPLFLGHALVIPKEHYETFYDLPADQLQSLMLASQKIGKALEAATDSQGTFIGMNNRISQSVPHVHVHLVPRKPKDGLKGFFWPRQNVTDDEMSNIRDKIAKNFKDGF